MKFDEWIFPAGIMSGYFFLFLSGRKGLLQSAAGAAGTAQSLKVECCLAKTLNASSMLYSNLCLQYQCSYKA